MPPKCFPLYHTEKQSKQQEIHPGIVAGLCKINAAVSRVRHLEGSSVKSKREFPVQVFNLQHSSNNKRE